MISIYQYVAIGIDFEGSIGLGRSTKKDSVVYRPKVEVYNNSRELLEHFKKISGIGNIDDGYENSGYAYSYTWKLRAAGIRLHLPLIEPHLILKRRQAELINEFMKIRKTPKQAGRAGINGRLSMLNLYTESQRARMEEIYTEAAELNLRGKSESLSDSEKLLRIFRQRGL